MEPVTSAEIWRLGSKDPVGHACCMHTTMRDDLHTRPACMSIFAGMAVVLYFLLLQGRNQCAQVSSRSSFEAVMSGISEPELLHVL